MADQNVSKSLQTKACVKVLRVDVQSNTEIKVIYLSLPIYACVHAHIFYGNPWHENWGKEVNFSLWMVPWNSLTVLRRPVSLLFVIPSMIAVSALCTSMCWCQATI